MKKFSFNLESLLTLRDWEEQNARISFSEANAEVERIRLRIEQIERSVEGTFDSWQGASGSRFVPGDRLALGSQIAQLERETSEARDSMKTAQSRRSQAMRALQEATRKRKVIGNLKEKRKREHFAEIERQERYEIEDIFNAKRSAT